MAAGGFVVSRRSDTSGDILFQTRTDRPAPTDDQLTLKDEVEHVLVVLRTLFPSGGSRFELYFEPLISLAQVGLSADPAQPAVARRALFALKNQVLAWEGARIKNKYMKELGLRSLTLGLPAAIVGLLVKQLYPAGELFAGFLVLWVGCMAGVWLSFGARKMTWSFDDLHIPEQDRLEPVVRLCFAGLLTTIVGLSFSTGTVIVDVGAVSTQNINDTLRVALLIGMLCGFSEQILSTNVAKQASSFLGPSR